MTVREIVADFQKEIRDTDLQPERARELDLKLSALLGNVNQELRQADLEYSTVLLKCMDGEEAANRAKIRAAISPEYQRFREAKDTRDLVVRLISGLRSYVRSVTEEMRLAR